MQSFTIAISMSKQISSNSVCKIAMEAVSAESEGKAYEAVIASKTVQDLLLQGYRVDAQSALENAPAPSSRPKKTKPPA